MAKEAVARQLVVEAEPFEKGGDPFAVMEGTRRKVGSIAPFTIIDNPIQSPFSPLHLEIAEIRECVDAVTTARRKAIVISEAMEREALEAIQSAGQNLREIDLRNSEDVEILERALDDLIRGLQAENTCLVVKGLEILDSRKITAKQRFTLLGNLRQLEDRARTSNNSMLVGVVSKGEIMPLFITHTLSPALLDAPKIGFETESALQPQFTEAPVEEEWMDMPRRSIEEMEGAQRRILAKKYADKIEAGISVVVFAPRRGGKTSMSLSVENEVTRRNQNIKFRNFIDAISIADLSLDIFDFTTEAKENEVRSRLKGKRLREIPALLNNLIHEEGVSLSSRRIVLKGDETLLRVEISEPEDLYEIAAFLKLVKEFHLPISLFSVESDFARGGILNKIKKDPANIEDVHLSAMDIAQFGLFNEDESRELLENLIRRAEISFSDETSRERFLSQATVICSGNVTAINTLMSGLNKERDIETALRRTTRVMETTFSIYLINMTPEQRNIIQTLIYSKGHTMVVRNAEHFNRELIDMQRRGFIDFHYKNSDMSQAVVKLKAVEGFKIVFMSYLKSHASNRYMDQMIDEIMREKGYSEEEIAGGRKITSEEEAETERERQFFRDLESAREKVMQKIQANIIEGVYDINDACEFKPYENVPGLFAQTGRDLSGYTHEIEE